MHVRPATAADAGALAALRYEFRAALATPSEDAPTFMARCERWMRARLDASPDWWAWVAATPEEVVGTVWLHRIEKMPNPVAEAEAHGYVTNLFVRPAARGAGVGESLLRAALEMADRQRFDRVILWPTPRSRSLYERQGFAVHGDLLARRGDRASSERHG